MKIQINRYYGDDEVTKSLVTVTMEGEALPALECEGREALYRRYTANELFAGWTRYCLPEGEMTVRMRRTRYSPMTLAIGPDVKRLATVIAWSRTEQVSQGMLLVGRANRDVPPEHRRIHDQRKVFERLDELVREAYVRGERVRVEISPLLTSPNWGRDSNPARQPSSPSPLSPSPK